MNRLILFVSPVIAMTTACSLIVDVEQVRRNRDRASHGADGLMGGDQDQNGGDSPSPCTAAWCPIVDSAIPGTYLNSIWASSAQDAWVVGWESSVLHWDGVAWSRQEVGLPTEVSLSFNKVWGFSSDDVWAVGDYTTAFHWDGSTWEEKSLGLEQGLSLRILWGSANDDLWTGADAGALYHWTGTGTWERSNNAFTESYFGLWGPRSDLFWIGGWTGTLIEFNGGSFTEVALAPPPSGVIQTIWGSSDTDVWLAGTYGTLYHRDATNAWSPHTIPGATNDDWTSLWGTAQNSLWLGGDRIMHFDGTTWTTEWSATADNVQGVFGADGKVWAVSFGVILERK